MPRRKLTYEQLEEKAHADMLNNMMKIYNQASHNNKKQYGTQGYRAARKPK